MRIVKATEHHVQEIAKVHVDSWKETYSSIIQEDTLKKKTYEKREELWKQIIKENQSITYVVKTDDDKVVGFVNGGKERKGLYEYDAEIYAIYILQGYQGQQIGKQLIHLLAKELYEQGYCSLLVWVVENNPSKYFYEKLKGELVDKQYLERLGVYEIAYGWSNMRILFKKD
ncbi:N-acetyltransferase family protein [Bacillus manliponensis]|uniref:GNAT family N-acetyltransferase n=1 Tax=Bacillus manliponensis TaxID=574376 RepID=UPI003516F7AD